MPAPVAIFAYNRPWHLNVTLNSLKNCYGASSTHLTIFIDGPRKNSDLRKIKSCIKISKLYENDFKSLMIFPSEKNKGCASSILDGIEKIFLQNETVIVLEDDIQVSPQFLNYMNKSLDLYKNKENVLHINAYNHEINTKRIKDANLRSVFLPIMFCWGWATWRDKWLKMSENPLSNDPFYLIDTISLKERYNFNLQGSQKWWDQVDANARGDMDTWAIFWFAHIFKSKGLCLTPIISLTRNIGFDGSGTHSGGFTNITKLNNTPIKNFPNQYVQDEKVLSLLRKFFISERKKSLIKKLINLFKSLFKLKKLLRM